MRQTFLFLAVITGFNTDIEFQGITYHVQTEDKGVATPLILSLVYHRGTILASKRSPYDDLLNNFDEKVLAERLQKQHKLICAAIRAGRIEDLKRMTMKESAAKSEGLIARKEVVPPKNGNNKVSVPAPQFLNEKTPEFEKPQTELPLINLDEALAQERVEAASPKTGKELIIDVPLTAIEAEPIVEAVRIVEEAEILPAEAVEIITDSTKIETPSYGALKIDFLGDSNFKSGEKKTISISVHRGNTEKGLSGAHVMVKVLGSAFRPLIFHAKTDSNGVATIHLQMPQFNSGRAIVLVKAMNEGEETELRRIISYR